MREQEDNRFSRRQFLLTSALAAWRSDGGAQPCRF
jgi:hypothetical protein